MKRLTLTVHGKVQGVFFRDGTKQVADPLGVTGRVRNNDDGSLSIVAEGPESSLRQLARWTELGPPLAKVDRVDAEWGEAAGDYDDFQIDY